MTAALNTGAATRVVQHSYEFKMPRSRGNVDVRLIESGNTRSEQLLTRPTKQLTD